MSKYMKKIMSKKPVLQNILQVIFQLRRGIGILKRHGKKINGAIIIEEKKSNKNTNNNCQKDRNQHILFCND